uniref:Uncharacterized protein LOC116942486 n=1 Tax=Petromyzon marinus TaxID=7757 RepID=A0AAJ7T4R3_PETMA|nr:uncharacterized protein LOC116942486 [Petromyzon marinus]
MENSGPRRDSCGNNSSSSSNNSSSSSPRGDPRELGVAPGVDLGGERGCDAAGGAEDPPLYVQQLYRLLGQAEADTFLFPRLKSSEQRTPKGTPAEGTRKVPERGARAERAWQAMCDRSRLRFEQLQLHTAPVHLSEELSAVLISRLRQQEAQRRSRLLLLQGANWDRQCRGAGVLGRDPRRDPCGGGFSPAWFLLPAIGEQQRQQAICQTHAGDRGLNPPTRVGGGGPAGTHGEGKRPRVRYRFLSETTNNTPMMGGRAGSKGTASWGARYPRKKVGTHTEESPPKPSSIPAQDPSGDPCGDPRQAGDLWEPLSLPALEAHGRVVRALGRGAFRNGAARVWLVDEAAGSVGARRFS